MAVYFIKEFGAPEAKDLFQAQIESIFENRGFIPLIYPRTNYFSRLFSLSQKIRSIPKGAVVFFIHPLYAKTNRLLLKALLRRNCKAVCVVSDINSLRDKTITFEKETAYWKRIRYFVFQNDRMRELVEKKYGQKISVTAQQFDLLFESSIPERIKSNEVVFAGNTAKCPFISDLNKVKEIKWRVYSAHYLPEFENVKHVFLQDEVSDKRSLEGSFGLVWEGDSIENISNFRGSYLKYISPMKLSNYLLHGMPVIIHKDAAQATFVAENKIGFCVSSLYEAGQIIEDMSEEMYREMLVQARSFSEKISSGWFAQSWINEILENLKPDQ